MPVYLCESNCHSCPALHRKTGPLVLRDNHSLAEGHWFFTDHCLLSTALTLSVPCSPMPMVSSVDQVAAYLVCSHRASVCLVDHVLHGNCPNDLGEPTMNGGLLLQGGSDKQGVMKQGLSSLLGDKRAQS